MKRKIQLLSLIVVSSILSGCFLKSVHPLVKPSDSISIPGLEGTWEEEDSRWTFIRSAEGNEQLKAIMEDIDLSYDGPGYLTLIESIEGTRIDSMLFRSTFVKLNGEIYMDLYPLSLVSSPAQYKNQGLFAATTFIDFHLVPVHTFSKIKKSDNELDILLFKDSWINDLIEKDRVRVKHEKTEDGVLLTASTDELQKFVKKYGGMEEAYDSPASLKKIE
jgi:hypothetical protein